MTLATIPARILLLLALAAGAGGVATAQELDESSLDHWLEFVLPAEDELQWREIPWRDAFWPAMEEAREAGLPVLLWVMNGHPLGCT